MFLLGVPDSWITIYIYIEREKISKVRYCHTFSVYLLDFYRGFTAFTDFQEDINVNIATMRNDKSYCKEGQNSECFIWLRTEHDGQIWNQRGEKFGNSIWQF